MNCLTKQETRKGEGMSEDDLKERVEQFNRGTLPGQPISVHMGITYLVNDLWREVLRLREDLSSGAQCPKCGLGGAWQENTERICYRCGYKP
jgi:hypothetical protein